ncbi:MAG: PKD domain-containing protein [Thermoplasmata archaeon]|nr:PKD domain-containing protein [Thermoplasmata archaeon]
MRYRYIAFLLISIFSLSALYAQGENAKVEIAAPSIVMTGENISVYVMVENLVLFNAADYTISYNATVLQPLTVENGMVNSTSIPVNFSLDAGKCRVVNHMGLEAVNGSGFLAVVKFSVLHDGVSYIEIEGNLSDLNGESIDAIWVGREIRATPVKVKVVSEVENGSIIASIDILNVENFGSINLTLLYDSSFLTPTSVINGTINGTEVAVETSFLQGAIRMVGWTSDENVTGNGSIASIKFLPRSNGITFINITDITISNDEAEEIYAVVENRTVIIAENILPVANFSFEPESPSTEEEIIFNASFSYDPDGTITNYTWHFGDGGIAYGMAVSHVYAMAGNYTVNLTVRDDEGAEDYMEKEINVSRANHPPLMPYNPSPQNGSADVALDTNLSWECSDEDGDALTYDVYFGTSSSPPKVASNITSKYYCPPNLQYSTTYYWRIVAWDVHGAKSIGNIWHFTTIPSYTLTVSSSPSNGGYVTPSGGTYEEGEMVTLTAHPYSGYVFSHWGGDASGSSATIQIVMDSDKNVVAYFIPSTTYYTLTTSVSPSNAGYIVLTPSGGLYQEGATVTITAHSYSGYVFSHWGGDASGSSATIQIVMNSDKNVVAYFISTSPPPPPPENHPPTISITSPQNGSTVSGEVTIKGTAYDEDGDSITVEIRIDGGGWNIAEGSTSWSYFLNASSLEEGKHVIYARAYDGKEYSEIKSIEIIVAKKNHPPVVDITSPLNGAIVSGVVTIKGTAYDEDGDSITVEIRIDGGEWENIGGENWSYSLNTTGMKNGEHVVYVRAYDGNEYGNIDSIKIVVKNEEGGGESNLNLIIIAVAAAVIIVIAGVWVYRRK